MGSTQNGAAVIDGPVIASGDFVITCPAQKTLALTTTVWDDIIILPSNLRPSGTTPPSWTVFQGGIYALAFTNAQSDEVYGSFELPHDYKEGTALHPHIHWAPSTNNNGRCDWTFEYTAQNMNSGAFPVNDTSITYQQVGGGIALAHQFISASAAIPGAGRKIGDVVVFRLARPTGDGFTGDAFLLSFGVHYEIDTMGSRQIGIK